MTSLCLYSVKDKPVRGETVHQGISSNEPFAFWGISSEMILELVSICSQCRYSSSIDCKNIPVVSLVLSLRTNKIVQRRHGVSSIPELELMLTSNWGNGIDYKFKKSLNPQINLPFNFLIQKYFFHDNPTWNINYSEYLLVVKISR